MNKPRKLLRHLGLYIGVVLVYTASTSAVAAECPNSLGFAKPGHRGIVRIETVAGGADIAWSITLERLRVRALP